MPGCGKKRSDPGLLGDSANLSGEAQLLAEKMLGDIKQYDLLQSRMQVPDEAIVRPLLLLSLPIWNGGTHPLSTLNYSRPQLKRSGRALALWSWGQGFKFYWKLFFSSSIFSSLTFHHKKSYIVLSKVPQGVASLEKLWQLIKNTLLGCLGRNRPNMLINKKTPSCI